MQELQPVELEMLSLTMLRLPPNKTVSPPSSITSAYPQSSATRLTSRSLSSPARTRSSTNCSKFSTHFAGTSINFPATKTTPSKILRANADSADGAVWKRMVSKVFEEFDLADLAYYLH